MYKKYTQETGMPKWLYRKIWLIMRLTTIIILITLLQVSAATNAQNVTLKKNNASLKSIFSDIKKQTGYMVIAPSVLINKAKPVTVNVTSTPLKDALIYIFENQNLEFEIQDNSIVVREKQLAISENINAAPATIDVHGRVVDEKGAPLAGVTVTVKSGGPVTMTDKDGNFLLKNMDEKAVLVISFVGYLTKEVNVSPDLETIALEVSNLKLDEVQVIAYGTTTKKFSTSNIASVKAADIAKQPVSNPLLALQGRVPGLFIEQASGVSGDGVAVTIQGVNSLQSGNDPFYVIDGVPYSPQFANSSFGGFAYSRTPSTLNFINPNDIESVSILKDADATAIYGSRAANGAILITTKKGKTGDTKVDFTLRNGWGKIDHKLKLLNTQQYLEMRKEAYKNDGLPVPTSATPPDESNYDLTIWDSNRYTDWQKVLVGGTAQFTDAQVSISGGSPSTQFLVGYGYNRQTSVYPNSLADTKGNIHFNLNHSSPNNKFKYLLSGTYLNDRNKQNYVDLMSFATSLAPNAPALFDANGKLNWEVYPDNPNRYSFTNPLAYTQQLYTDNTSNLIANNTVSYELLKGLVTKISLGYNKLQGDGTSIIPFTSLKPDGYTNTRSASYLSRSISSWIIEPQITYNINTNIGLFDILIGSTFSQTRTDLLNQTGSGYTDDSQLLNILSASNVNINAVTKSLYKYDAFFTRFNYRLQDKYIINLTARRDGSSRFGDENKLHTFYALGGAWLFSEETLVKKFNWLSSGKLRVNYGTTGNDQISDYTYQSLLETYRVDIPYQGGTGIYPTSIYNPYLQWEETRKLNVGASFGFLKERIQLDVDFFRNRSSNQLVAYLLPTTTGFPAIVQNFGATVQNMGFEIMLNLSLINSKNFKWQSSVNFTNPKNKLIAFPGLETSPYSNQYVIGQPINVIKTYKYSGVNSSTGLYEFIDHNGKNTSTPNEVTDKSVLIDPNPKWYGGITNSFQFQDFELDFLITATKQMAPNYQFGKYPGLFGPTFGNQPANVLERWTNPGDISNVQKLSTTLDVTGNPYNYATQSNELYSGASYIRLKNASISYTLPQRFVKQVHLTNVKVFIQGQNLITITKFVGTDPETKSIASLPPLRMFTVGVQAGF